MQVFNKIFTGSAVSDIQSSLCTDIVTQIEFAYLFYVIIEGL